MPTRPSVASRKRTAADPETKMLRAVADYLESKGWLCIVAGAKEIRQPYDLERIPGTDNFKFELVIGFTGGKKKADGAAS